jgi:hypothetical protein
MPMIDFGTCDWFQAAITRNASGDLLDSKMCSKTRQTPLIGKRIVDLWCGEATEHTLSALLISEFSPIAGFRS